MNQRKYEKALKSLEDSMGRDPKGNHEEMVEVARTAAG